MLAPAAAAGHPWLETEMLNSGCSGNERDVFQRSSGAPQAPRQARVTKEIVCSTSSTG
jgi:hypothetical protein